MTFDQFGLAAPLVQAVAAEGYTTPTPIQQKAIPLAMQGRDVLGVAQTGTGKTAAFALPILHRLASVPHAPQRKLRALVITPTRELATQVADSFGAYGRHTGLRHTVMFGGVGQEKQVDAMRRGVDILVATPGRLLDLMQQRLVSLQTVEILVLDEADRMLDMGFIHDVKRIIAAVPKQRQTLFFSATMPQEIQSLVHSILKDPVRVEVTPVATTAEKVEQRLFHVEKGDKRALLIHVLKDAAVKSALVFTRTKSGANRLTKQLQGAGVEAEVIHGNKSQNARERALHAFKNGHARVLVATDIAARGIDIDGVSHVVNFDVPNIPETYVHRIGRTARAGNTGIALSFCDREERAYVRDIERTIRMQIPVEAAHPFVAGASRPASSEPREEQRPRPQNDNRPRQNRGGGQRRRRGGGGGGGGGQRSQAQGSSSSSGGGSSAASKPAHAPSSFRGASRRQGKPAPKWY